MAKNRRSRRNPQPVEEPKSEPKVALAVRETIESVAIAFVLAFVFRTFIAEAFIIPTGSMSPSLMGAHKDVDCEQCGTRFKVNSSTDDQPSELRPWYDAGVGMCPQCRHVATFDKEIGDGWGDPTVKHEDERTYPGDRIVVSKYQYVLNEPKRWDVVVFKYPGDAVQNFIKRLVGLPNETLRVWQGDVFIRPGTAGDNDFAIERKPPKKVMAMRQLVHDTDHDPAALRRHGFPLRWSGDEDSDWTVTEEIDDNNVKQTYHVDADANDASWLRYRHQLADTNVWSAVNAADLDEAMAEALAEFDLSNTPPQLISDFNSYNTRRYRAEFLKRQALATRQNPNPGLPPPRRPRGGGSVINISATDLGMHWVGDLMLEAEVEVESNTGTLWLQLVEAGHRFRCAIDVATGQATLSIVPWDSDGPTSDFTATTQSKLKGTGSYKVAFANVDDQLLLWIDGDLVKFDDETTYDWDQLFGPRESARPQVGENQTGDLAPIAVGSDGVELTIDRLKIYRDIYYIADRQGNSGISEVPDKYWGKLLDQPENWDYFTERLPVDFLLAEDQFFVMGDNSPQSSDARVWSNHASSSGGQPPGPYLERSLLIGRAVFVAWPHPWYYIPNTPIPVFPNFGDMRLIR